MIMIKSYSEKLVWSGRTLPSTCSLTEQVFSVVPASAEGVCLMLDESLTTVECLTQQTNEQESDEKHSWNCN